MGNSEFGNIIKSYLLDWCTKYHMKSCILSFFLVYVLFGIHEVKYPLNFVPAQEDVRLTNHLSDGAIADGSGFMAEYVTNQMIDSLSAPVPAYLENFNNPCWLEMLPPSIEDVYKNATYYKYFKVNAGRFLDQAKRMYTKQKELGVSRRLRCLPSIYILGFTKCGTTDLFEALKKHPGMESRIPLKEPTFWNRHNYGREPRTHKILRDRKKSLNDYAALYDYAALSWKMEEGVDEENIRDYLIGDASSTYIWDFDGWQDMPQNQGMDAPVILAGHLMRHFTPHAKLIVIMRNPVERMYSDYLYVNHGGESSAVFHEYVVKSIQEMQSCFVTRSERSCLYDPDLNGSMQVRLRASHYAVFIEDWLSVFPREQFYFIRLEEYSLNKTEALSKICDFLKLGEVPMAVKKYLISNNDRAANKRSRADRLAGDMLPETRKLLEEYFHPWNERLALLMEDPGYLWNSSNMRIS